MIAEPGRYQRRSPTMVSAIRAAGESTDTYSSTPHSGGYYHVAETYWPQGAMKSVAAPGMPTLYYGASDASGLDGEGRVTKVTASSGQNPVTGVTYKSSGTPIGALTQVTYGSADSDNFTIDSNTGRMSQYQLNMGSLSDTGTLTWNANGSLGALAIVDQINSANTQTCNFSHDDLGRIASANCGSAIWQQNFSYDPFGNINKTVPTGGTGISFTPGYSTTTNRYSSGLPGLSYDTNGNLLNDSYHSYTWDAEGKMASVDGNNVTYDALGRMVENYPWQQFIYLAGGQRPFASMNGASLALGYVPLPGGGFVVYNSSGVIQQYNHSDWLGSARLITTPSRTLYADMAYAPYGEAYANNGWWVQFTSNGNQWTVSGLNGLDDFMFRRYHPTQGRWISPDPAGMAAVVPGNPQSWNRYAYVMHKSAERDRSLGTRDEGCFPDHPFCNPCDPWIFCFPPVPGGPLPPGPPPGPPPPPPPPDQRPRVGGNWPNGETLGLPTGMNLKPMSLAELLGLSPGTGCEFGVCVPIGNGFVPALAGGGALEGIGCAAQPEACAAILIGGYIAIKYGPQIVHAAKDAAKGAGTAIAPYNQYLQDLKACYERFVPGPDRDECVKQAT